MATTEKDILEFGIFVDIRDSLKAIEQFQREMTSTMRDITKSSEDMGKAAEKAAKRATDATEDQTEALKDTSEAYDKQNDAIKDIEKTLEHLRKISKKKNGEDKKALDEQIKGLEKRLKAEKKDGGGSGGKSGGSSDKSGNFLGDLRKAGEALKEPLQNFLQKDAKSLMAASFKLGGKTLARSIQMSSKGLMSGGGGLSKLGATASTQGKMRGGGTGALMRAGGAGMKGMGLAMEKMGKSLSFLTKLGPVLGVLSSGVMGLLKMFIDADAMVKEFNKDIMSSASNAELLARNGGDLNATMLDMDDTLQGLRDAALDFRTNMSLGITKEEHKAVISVLNQEGVTLRRINEEAELSGKSVKELATQLTTTGVAYSRAFGVPLQEINQLQARMMTEMGRSLGETQQSFAMMTRAATESGIASNKFFGMIRGVSADLSLYNLRLEDSVALLSKLGTVMSPENAQKFLQSAMTMAKGMGRQQKLQMGFFVGAGKLNKIVSKDIERDSKNLMQKIAQQTSVPAEALQEAFDKDGAKGLNKFLNNVPKEAKGAIMESIMDLQLKSSRASKGMYGKSQAVGDLGPGAFLEALNEAITKFSPEKDIAKAVGSIGLEATAEALGISQEQVDQMAKLQLAVNLEKDAMLAKADGNAAEMKRIQEMTTGDIINGFSDEMKKNLKLGEEGVSLDEQMKRLAEQQGQRTQGMTQKLETLVDWFMGEFYNTFQYLVSLIDAGFFGSKDKVNAMKRAKKYGNAELEKAAGKEDFRKAIMGTGIFKTISGAASQGAAKRKELAAMRTAVPQGDAKSQQAHVDRMHQLTQEVEQLSRVSGEYVKNFSVEDFRKAALDKNSGLSENLRQKFKDMPSADSYGGGKGLADLRDSLSPEELEGVMKKLVWHASRDSLVDAIGQTSKFIGASETPGITSGSTSPSGKIGAGLATSPSAQAPSPVLAPLQEQAAIAEKSSATLDNIATGTSDLHKTMTQQGVKLDRGQLKSDVSNEMETSMLAALRQALYEYYLYSGIQDRSKVAQAFGKAGGAKSGAAALGGLMSNNPISAEAALAEIQTKANAGGGIVTGINGGLAQVTAAAGEGLASVGRGERIVPAGGGGGGNTFPIHVNGIGGRDLANLIETKVVEGVREYKRREKFD